MRTWVVALMLVPALLAGCTDEGSVEPPNEEPQQASTSSSTTNTTSVTSTTSTGPVANVTSNEPPTANLTADVTSGEAPLTVTFGISGSDPDGDALTWSLDADGDGVEDANGTELPAMVEFTFEEAGNYTANLAVSDGHGEASAVLTIQLSAPAEPVALAEVFYLHDEDGGDGTMDHTPAPGREGGHGLANLLATGYAKAFPATEATLYTHAAGSKVSVHVQAFPLAPHPLVTMEAILKAEDGTVLGSATNTQTAVALALVSTPCTEWVMTFTLTADLPAGTLPQLEVDADNVLPMAGCYPGGEAGPRVVLSA